MDEKKTEKLLSADIDSDLADNFLSQADERGYRKKRALAAAIKLWIELPTEIQARLLDLSLDGSSFIELVRKIADEQIAKGSRAGRALLERQNRKKAQKG